MTVRRGHLVLVESKSTQPATYERRAADPRSAAEFIVALFNDELHPIGNPQHLFRYEPIRPPMLGMCAYHLENVGRPDLPYASAEIAYLLEDGRKPVELYVALHWQPNRVLPYYTPGLTPLPVVGTIDRLDIKDYPAQLTCTPETDAAAYIEGGVNQTHVDQAAIDDAYRRQRASGEPPMMANNHLAATDEARHQWCMDGLQQTVDFFSQVALADGYADYDICYPPTDGQQ